MFIKTHISTCIRGSIEKHDNVWDLLKAIYEQFSKFKKSLVSTLIIKFSTLRLNGVEGVQDHIMSIMDITTQLKNLEVTMSESFLVHYILCTLTTRKIAFLDIYSFDI